MQQSNTVGQNSASLGQAFAAIGILVGLAITVPIFGILMIPAVALGGVARALVDAADEVRGLGLRVRVAARPTPASRRPAALGASYPSPCAPETSP